MHGWRPKRIDRSGTRPNDTLKLIEPLARVCAVRWSVKRIDLTDARVVEAKRSVIKGGAINPLGGRTSIVVDRCTTPAARFGRSIVRWPLRVKGSIDTSRVVHPPGRWRGGNVFSNWRGVRRRLSTQDFPRSFRQNRAHAAAIGMKFGRALEGTSQETDGTSHPLRGTSHSTATLPLLTLDADTTREAQSAHPQPQQSTPQHKKAKQKQETKTTPLHHPHFITSSSKRY